MFNLPSFFRSVFILIVLFSVLFAATNFSSPVKQQLSGVLGVKVEEKSPLPENLQKDVNASIEDVKDKAMETDANDVVNLTKRFNKVVNDYHALQKEIEKQMDEFFENKADK